MQLASRRPLTNLAAAALSSWQRAAEADPNIHVVVLYEIIELRSGQRFAIDGDRAWELLRFRTETDSTERHECWEYQPAVLPDGGVVYVSELCEGGRSGVLHHGQSSRMRAEGHDPIPLQLSSWLYASEARALASGELTARDMVDVLTGRVQ